MSAGPSIADLLEQSHRELAGTDARVYRRVADHLQRSSAALHDLQDPQPGGTQARKVLLGKGSFLQQSAASLKRLCKEHGIKYSECPSFGVAFCNYVQHLYRMGKRDAS